MVHVAQMKMTQMFLHDIKKKKENMHMQESERHDQKQAGGGSYIRKGELGNTQTHCDWTSRLLIHVQDCAVGGGLCSTRLDLTPGHHSFRFISLSLSLCKTLQYMAAAPISHIAEDLIKAKLAELAEPFRTSVFFFVSPSSSISYERS